MPEGNQNRHDVQPDDAQRLNRLSEEIRARLTETALIVGRVAGEEPKGGAVSKFIPREAALAQPAAEASDWMEIVEFAGITVAYGSIGGHAFIESPPGP